MIEGSPKGFDLMRAATLNILMKLLFYNNFQRLKQLQREIKKNYVRQMLLSFSIVEEM